MTNEETLRKWRREALLVRRDSLSSKEFNPKTTKYLLKVFSYRLLTTIQELSDQYLLQQGD